MTAVQLRGPFAGPAQSSPARTEQLVKHRGTDSYKKEAALLADLREALAGGDKADLAEQQARKLKDHNPTLRILVSELRRTGFLAKPGKS